MSRAFWFVAGAGAGVYGLVKARRVAEALTPDGLRDRRTAYALGARMLRDEAAAASAEKEIELRQRLGLVPTGRPELVSTSSTGVNTSSTGVKTSSTGVNTSSTGVNTSSTDVKDGN